jgi:hypothetical protein
MGERNLTQPNQLGYEFEFAKKPPNNKVGIKNRGATFVAV